MADEAQIRVSEDLTGAATSLGTNSPNQAQSIINSLSGQSGEAGILATIQNQAASQGSPIVSTNDGSQLIHLTTVQTPAASQGHVSPVISAVDAASQLMQLTTVQNQTSTANQVHASSGISAGDAATQLMQLAQMGLTAQQQQQLIQAAQSQVLQHIQGLASSASTQDAGSIGPPSGSSRMMDKYSKTQHSCTPSWDIQSYTSSPECSYRPPPFEYPYRPSYQEVHPPQSPAVVKVECSSPQCLSGAYSVSGQVYQQPSSAMIVTAANQSYYSPQQVGPHPHMRHPSEVEGRPIAHPGTRASPATVQWLLDNYETTEGVSLPRNLLYSHYLRHCNMSKVEPVNAASFGKLIRSVFIGLKTRRLGTRGNSKYHYYGIRIKPDSPLNNFQDEMIVEARRQQPSHRKEDGAGEGSDETFEENEFNRVFLPDSFQGLHDFPTFVYSDLATIPEQDISSFLSAYREHCEAIVDVVVHLQFQMVDQLWQNFWGLSTQETQGEFFQPLPPEKVVQLFENQAMIDYINSCDHILYQCIVDTLLSDVLKPIPGTLTQAIRNFAKGLEGWLTNSLQGYPRPFVQLKVSTVVAFSQTLRRYTSLNHLAQAARAVLQNSSQVSQMLNDLNRVDFGNVQEQAYWVCQCEEGIVSQIERDFKQTLQRKTSLEDWSVWLDNVVTHALKAFEGAEFSEAARQFLLKWSFYSSMVIRDLTLRSAASFGSFHLIRLLFDEYMFFLVEHKVAKSTNRTPIAIMSEFSSASSMKTSDTVPRGNNQGPDHSPSKVAESLQRSSEKGLEPPPKMAKIHSSEYRSAEV